MGLMREGVDLWVVEGAGWLAPTGLGMTSPYGRLWLVFGADARGVDHWVVEGAGGFDWIFKDVETGAPIFEFQRKIKVDREFIVIYT